MKVAIAHQDIRQNSDPDDLDVLVQAETIGTVLRKFGIETFHVPCASDLDHVRGTLERTKPDMVFNLVESLDGQGRLIHLFPQLLDRMHIPYSGAPSWGILATSDKILAKKTMRDANLPTPPWVGPYPHQNGSGLRSHSVNGFSWIIKSQWEHASIGLDENEPLIFPSASTDLEALMKRRAPELGGTCFAEKYIDGREFNLSVLAGENGPETLPHAEILFEGYPVGKPKIVGYRAKWDPDAYEYHHTPRRFDFPPEDTVLLETLERMAKRCWEVFGLRGYARVDFRVDAQGKPWILEINANPCLSPDAGFAAALEQAGIDYADAIRRIMKDSLPLN